MSALQILQGWVTWFRSLVTGKRMQANTISFKKKIKHRKLRIPEFNERPAAPFVKKQYSETAVD